MTSWGAVRLSFGVILAVLGTVLLLASIPAALASVGIVSSVGRTGVVTEGLGTLRAADGDRAVIVDDVGARLVLPAVHPWIEQGLAMAGTSPSDVVDGLGSTVLVATSTTDADAFIGVGPVEAVNDYLTGTPYSVAVREGGEWPTISVPGTRTPQAPTSATLWSAFATGVAPELPAESLGGSTMVLMRTDAQPGVEAALRLEYRVPGAGMALQSSAVFAAACSVGGLLIVLLAGALVVGRRPRVGAGQ